MERVAMEIAYDGTDFFGWQSQVGQISVQETIELVLSKLHSNKEIKIVGCGRTDSGVHAHTYLLHCDLPTIENNEQFLFKVNRMLPRSISVQSIRRVEPQFHARFDAKWRTYRYHIHTEKNPFKDRFSTYLPVELNIELMNETAFFLIGKHDFTSFSKVSTEVTTAICEVKKAKWMIDSENIFYFEITSNRFLRNMVRATVGNLLLVGQRKMSKEQFIAIFEAKDRSLAKGSADAQGLFLWEVEY